MRISVLGCSGSITGNLRTTCYRVDDDILIDAGTGVGDLTLQQAIAIDHVFLTHAHLDHSGLLPMLADAAGGFRDVPLTVHALPDTIHSLKRNMLNGELWPDYTVRPSPARPYIRFAPVEIGEAVELNGRKVTALPAKHSIPCAGYRVDSGEASWVYSGDTTLFEEFWQALNHIPNLKYLLVEATFRNDSQAAALHAGHMTAQLLAQGLHMLQHPAQLYIVHMEAGHEEETLREIHASAGAYRPEPLQRGHMFEL